MSEATAGNLSNISETLLITLYYRAMEIQCPDTLIDKGIREGIFSKVNFLLAARLPINNILSAVYGFRAIGISQQIL